MLGLDSLLAMRRRGVKPSGAVVDTNPSEAERELARTWAEQRHVPHLALEPRESLGLLDLRAFVGVNVVLVYGNQLERVVAVCEAIVAAGAKVVRGGLCARRGWGEEIEDVFAHTPEFHA